MSLAKISISLGNSEPAAAGVSLTDPKTLGAMALVLVAAAVIGVGVHRWLSPNRYATTLGFLAASGFVGLLAYLGVPAAGYIVAAMLVVLAIVWALAAFANS
jgi:hypothetical protein